jgi:hypothetical protein
MVDEFETSSLQNRSNLSSVEALIYGFLAQYGAGISVLASIILCLLLSGCQRQMRFQLREVISSGDSGARRSYDSTGDGQADFFTFADSSGRISRIGYDNDVDAVPDVIVNMDEIPAARCRHLVIIVDGFGYDLVKRYYDSGKLRMFHSPSRVVAPYPSVTEVSLSAIMGSSAPRAIQSRYFDRKTNSLIGGVMDYIRGKNEPFAASLTYRADQHVDGLGYILGMPVFVSELNTLKQLYDKRQTRELIAYLVSTSAVSVRSGATGQIECLKQLDRFITELLWQSRGLVKVTMLADHGLGYEKAEHLDLEKHLTDRDWLVKDRLDGPRDVVLSTLGVVTYACFSTRSPAALSEDLIACEGVELVSYARKDAVEVLSSNGDRAVVRARNRRFIYEPLTGDPLLLKPILESLEKDEHGSYDPDDLLEATVTHIYPTPLQRLWQAHFCRVENPPDVIVSLQDRYCSGPTSFSGMVPINSTHGSLNYRNSVTFLMSTVGTFRPVMRSGDIRKQMEVLLGNPWPMKE